MSGQRRAPAALSPRKSPGTHYTGSWVGTGDGLKGNGDKKIPGFQLYRLHSPGPRTHCVVYSAHRHIRKADRFTAQLASPQCVLAHQSRFLRTSHSPSVYGPSPRQESGQIHRSTSFPTMCSRASVAVPKNKWFPLYSQSCSCISTWHDSYSRARFATGIFVRLCCPQWFAGLLDFQTPIRTRTRHYSKPLDRNRWFFSILQLFAVHNRKQYSFLFRNGRYEEHDRYFTLTVSISLYLTSHPH